MKVSIIANCERCHKKFFFEKDSGSVPLPVINRAYEVFGPEDKLTNHKYLRSIEITQLGHVDAVLSKAVVYCQECDREYWTNFKNAQKLLEAFWHQPLKDQE